LYIQATKENICAEPGLNGKPDRRELITRLQSGTHPLDDVSKLGGLCTLNVFGTLDAWLDVCLVLRASRGPGNP
jgi:hypothetical protein